MSDSQCTWFVHGGLVLDPIDGIARRRELLVRDGTIAATYEPGSAAAAAGATLPMYDAGDTLILPGLINAHTHGHASIMKGVADRWPLELSLTHGPWLSGPREPELMYLATLLGAVEMLAGGITSCYDLVYEFPHATAAGLRAVAQAYADAGMRAVVAPMIADRSLFEAYPELTAALPAHLAERVGRFALTALEETVAVIVSVLEGPPMPPGTRLGIAPTIPLHCTDALLAACRDLRARAALPMQMHLAESRFQATAGARAYGRSLTAHIDRMGLLGPHFTAAHGVWLDAADLDCLAAAGASVAHVPASNFRLGSGLAHVRSMLDRGINVALATDGANSSDALDMLVAMRLASFASRAYADEPDRWLASRDVFRMATLAGATALGMSEHLGRPTAGYAADLVFIDLAHPQMLPLNEPLNQIVNGSARAIRDVMVAGRFVVRAGRARAWTATLRERLAASCERLQNATLSARAFASELAPHVARYLIDRRADPVAIERHISSPHRHVRITSP